MCGIFGSIGTQQKIPAEVFFKALKNRGPDGCGHYISDDKNVMLGHVRLAIIGTDERGNQPMEHRPSRSWITFNGEVYNYKEIRDELVAKGYTFQSGTDTEVVHMAFLEWRENSFKKLRGMYAFAIYEEQHNTITFVRDRLGIKPLIFSKQDGAFYFSSELRPFLDAKNFQPKLNHAAIHQILQYGSVNQPQTILKDFNHLPKGSYLTLSIDSLDYKICPYYDLIERSQCIEPTKSYSEAVIQIKDLLVEATKYHMVADVEVGAFLSGGVDSSAVVALMQRQSSKPIKTFTVGFANDMGVDDESALAAENAKTMGTDHHPIAIESKDVQEYFSNYIDGIDQPSVDGLNTFIVSSHAKKYVKVCLSGLGGDEVFCGYPHFKKIFLSTRYSLNPIHSILRGAHDIRPSKFTLPSYYARLSVSESTQKTREFFNLARIKKMLLENPSLEYPLLQDERNLSILQNISKTEIDNYLLNTLLRDSDVVGMANSLELRPILLDHPLVEYAFSLKDSHKLNKGILKSALKDAVIDLIPAHCLSGKKKGFELPFISFMKNELRENCLDIVRSESSSSILNKKYIKTLENKLTRNQAKHRHWIFIVLLSWLEKNKSMYSL